MGLTNPTGSSIKSIQRGRTSFLSANTTQNITVSSVNTAKSHLVMLGFYSGGAATVQNSPNITLSSSTTIALNRQTGGVDMNVSWELVEYN